MHPLRISKEIGVPFQFLSPFSMSNPSATEANELKNHG
jgi:hypothetical protein